MAEENSQVLVIKPFGKSPELKLDVTSIRAAEVRYIEAKNVNPSTYSDLEHAFNESYRTLKGHLSNLGYQLTLAEKQLREEQANVFLGSYAEYLKDKPKYADNPQIRDAYLIRDPNYVAALDRVNQLKAFISNFEGKIKTVENVCKYMRQKMYLISKSGVPYQSVGITIKDK
jgi:hypothetical protein